MTRSSLALFSAIVCTSARWLLVAAGVLGAAVPDAAAQYATGGAGLFRNQILWFSWAAHDAPIPNGTTVTNTYQLADRTLAVTCRIENVSGGVTGYQPGIWAGDSFDDLYNIGGTGGGNDLVVGVATDGVGTDAFDFTCAATLDGNPLPLPGLVFGDAEVNAGTEFIDATISNVGTTWRIIDRLRDPACASQQQLTLSAAAGTTTLRMGIGAPTSCAIGPGTVAFMEGATAARVVLRATGRTAVALGVVPPGVDFGDAPPSYPMAGHTVQEVWTGGTIPLGTTGNYNVTLATLVAPPLRLGAGVDVDPSPRFSFDGSGDDLDVTDDEDGVVIPALVPGATVAIQVTVPSVTASTRVQGWIDWGRDGSFAEPGDQILTDATVVAGVNTFNVPVPLAFSTPTYARFRIADQSGVGPSGLANSGEVEDYADIVMSPADWGDAPASYGTSLSGNGPRHLIAGPYLGAATPDAEADGAPSAAADGDDAAGDDEDGVVMPAMFARGATVPIQVTVGNASADTRLSAWIDWLGDGSFANVNDRILVDVPVVNGVNTFNVPVPLASLAAGTVTNTFARFRLADASGLASSGLVLSGEVEDYPVVVQSTADISVTKTDNSPYYIAGTNVTYTIVVANAGPTGVTGNNVRIFDPRPTGTTGGSWTCTATNGANCHSPGGTIVTSGTGNIGSILPQLFLTLPANSTITFSYTITVPASFTGNLVNTATLTVSAAIDPKRDDNAATDTDTPVPADLTITKVSTPNPYVANAPFSYTIVASNLGPANAPGSTITDSSLPSAVNGFAWSCTGSGGASCGTASGTVSGGSISTLANLPVGGSATIVATGTLPIGTTGVLTNTATVTPPANVPDPVMTNNTATDINPAPRSADLRISKASTPNPYVPGSPLTYTIVASNAGPDDVLAARVQDTMPAAFAAFTWTCAASGGATCPATGGTGDIDTLVDLPVGATATFTITGTVPSSYTGVADNTATITPPPGTPDPVPGNNTSIVPNPPNVIADLAITKTQGPDPYVPGTPLTYTLLVRNLGPSDATNARVQDTLPGVLTNVAWTCAAAGSASCGTPTGVNVVDALVTLPAGSAATFTVTADVPASVAGTLTNTSTVTPPTDVTDPDPGNNTSTVTSGPGPEADLSVVKTASVDPYVPGTDLSFTIVVSNAGPSDALNARVQDLFPSALSHFTWTCAPSQGAAACGVASGQSLVDVFVDLPVGGAVTFTATGLVPADLTGTITNTATVTPPVQVRDPNPPNNASTVTLGPGPRVDLRVTKTSTPNPYVPGSPITYTLVFANGGPSAVANAAVQDNMPAALQNVTWTCSAVNGTCPAPNGTGHINSTIGLSPGGTVTFTIVGDVPANTRGVLVNSATIVPPQGMIDTTPNNNTGVDSNPTVVVGGPVDLQITQEFPGVAPPNGLLTFRLRTRNLGPGTAINPYMTGMIPPGTTFVSVTPSAGGTCNVPGNPPPPDPVTGYPIAGVGVAPLRCTWPGLMKTGDSHYMEFTVRVAPGTATGQILWSCWWTWPDNEDIHHPNNVIDAYLFVHDGTSPVGDLQIQGAAAVVSATSGDSTRASFETIGTELAVRVGADVPIRFWVTNHGPAATRGQYALILDMPNTLQIVDVQLPQGWVSPSGPSSAVWDTGTVLPGQTVALDMTVRLLTPSAVELFAQRITGSPGDPNASNERATIVLDGYAPGMAGRWVAVGNVDGAGAGEILTGAGQGEMPQVRVFTGTGADTGTRFFAYERSFAGGVQIASCDVDGDGIAELITAPGPGRASTIRVLSLVGGVVTELIAFDAFEAGFLGGASIACADLDADGAAELVIGAGPGRAPEVQVYNVGLSTVTPRASFLAYEAGFLGGVRVAAGVYAGRPGWLDAFAIATTPGTGRAAELRLWTSTGGPVAQVVVSSATNGVLPTLGDVNGDGQLDLLLAPDDGRPELVRIFEIDSGEVLGDVPGNLPGFPVGIRTAVGVLTGGPGQPEIVIGNGPGGHPRVRVVFWPPSGPIQRLEILPLEIP